MSKLEVFDGKQTNWCGLWYHPESCGFSSQAINLSKLKQFKGAVRLYVRKNKFYNNGENGRPNYCFCIKDSDSESFIDMEVRADEDECEEDDLYHLTHDELQTLIDLVACTVGGDSEYGMNCVSDFFNTNTKKMWK